MGLETLKTASQNVFVGSMRNFSAGSDTRFFIYIPAYAGCGNGIALGRPVFHYIESITGRTVQQRTGRQVRRQHGHHRQDRL